MAKRYRVRVKPPAVVHANLCGSCGRWFDRPVTGRGTLRPGNRCQACHEARDTSANRREHIALKLWTNTYACPEGRFNCDCVAIARVGGISKLSYR